MSKSDFKCPKCGERLLFVEEATTITYWRTDDDNGARGEMLEEDLVEQIWAQFRCELPDGCKSKFDAELRDGNWVAMEEIHSGGIFDG